MAQHFTQSKTYRDFTDEDFDGMTEQEAWQWFCLARWGSLTMVTCPICNQTDKHYAIPKRKQWRCKHCYHHFSVTSQTPFSKRHLSFLKLLKMVYLFSIAPKGCAANQVCGKLKITYRSAWQNISKIRESMFHAQDRTPMSGLVHADGGHFCGKPRRPRVREKMTSAIVNNHLKNRKANIIPPSTNYSITPKNREKLKNRRIVLAIVEGTGAKGAGAQRTITCVLKAEVEKEVIPAIKRNVRPGTVIYTDAGNAYSSLIFSGYCHETVNHSKEYCRKDGVNNNLAEAFISRFRRAEYGDYHGMRPQYFSFYAAEVAWRQDMRKVSMKTKLLALLKCVMAADISQAFRGYAQGHRLRFEYLG